MYSVVKRDGRIIDFDLGKYRLKIESDGDTLPKKEFYSTFTDTTLVSNFILI